MLCARRILLSARRFNDLIVRTDEDPVAGLWRTNRAAREGAKRGQNHAARADGETAKSKSLAAAPR